MTFSNLGNLCKEDVPISLAINGDIITGNPAGEIITSITDKDGNGYNLTATIVITEDNTLTFISNAATYLVKITLKDAPNIKFKNIAEEDLKRCKSTSINPEFEIFENVDDATWLVSSGNSSDTPPFEFTKSGDITITARATNAACPSHPSEDVLRFVVNEEPIFNPQIIIDRIEKEITACSDCYIDYPDGSYLDVSMGNIISSSISWHNAPNPIALSGRPTGFARMTVDSINECGTTQKEIERPNISLRINALNNCVPGISSISESNCICSPIEFDITNRNSAYTTFSDADIKFNIVETGGNLSLNNSTPNKIYSYKYIPENDGLFIIELDYDTKCPSESKPIFKRSLSKQSNIKTDTCLDYSYTYCIGDTASFKCYIPNMHYEIENVEILPPLKDKFEISYKDEKRIYFSSVDTIMDTIGYSILHFEIKYKLLGCDSTFLIIKDTANLEPSKCEPFLSATYTDNNTNTACIGDTTTISVGITGENSYIDSLFISKNDSISLFYNKRNRNSVFYNLISYTQNLTKTNLDFTIYYNRGGVKDTVVIKEQISVRDCPPTFRYEIELDTMICPGNNIILILSTTNPSNKEELTIIDLETTPQTRIESEEPFYIGSNWVHRYSSTVLGSTMYKYTIQYNEGNIISTKTDSIYVKMDERCAPKFIYDTSKMCLEDVLFFHTSPTSYYENLIEVIWDDEVENKIQFIKEEEGQFYFSTTLDSGERKFFAATLITECKDTTLSYKDTVFTNLIPSPKAFTRDTTYVCRGSSIDLSEYEYSEMLNDNTDIVYPNNSSILHNVIVDQIIKVTAFSAFNCGNMDDNNSFIDSIWVLVDSVVYLDITNSIRKICKNDTINLTASSNGRLIWSKSTGSPPNTVTIVLDTVNDTDTIKDIVTETSVYSVVAFNTCISSTTVGTITANVIDLPNIANAPDTILSCPNTSIILTDYCTDCSTSDWLIDGETKNNGDELFSPIDYNTIAKFKGVNSTGCKSTKDISIISYKIPKVTQYIEYKDENSETKTINLIDDSKFCLAYNTEHTAYIKEDEYSYKWLCEGFPIGNSINIKLTKDSIIKVERTFNGCKDTIYFNCFVSDIFLEKNVDSTCISRPYVFSPSYNNTENIIKPTLKWIFENSILTEEENLNIDNVDLEDAGIYSLITTKDVCKDTHNLELKVFPTPEPSVTAPTIICENFKFELSINTNIEEEENNVNFTWISPKGDTINQQNLSINSFSYTDTGTYYYSAFTKVCKSEVLSLHLSLKEKIIPTFDIKPSYCEGDEMCLIANEESEQTSYLWSISKEDSILFDTVTYGLNSPVCNPLSLEYNNVNIRLISNDSICSDTSMTRLLIIHERPKPELSKDKDFYCIGDSATLDAKNLSSDINEVKWIFNNNITASQTNFAINNIDEVHQGWYSFSCRKNMCYNTPDSIYVEVRPLPEFTPIKDTLVCLGDTIFIGTESESATYLWNTGSRQIYIDITKKGEYFVDINLNSCIIRENVSISEREKPIFTLANDTAACRGGIVEIYGPENMEKYLWSTGETENIIMVGENDTYSLSVTNEKCSYTDYIKVTFLFCGTLHFPSAFTPNGDRVNDEFGVFANGGNDDIEYQLYIYNRNGTMVFSTKDITQKWDGKFKGKACPAGVYVYKCISRNKETGEDLSTNGSVTIIL